MVKRSDNAHGSSMARWKARDRLPISVTWTFFAGFHGSGTMVKIVVFERGVGQFERKLQGDWGVVHQQLLASENCSPWAITWRCLRNPTFSRFDTEVSE